MTTYRYRVFDKEQTQSGTELNVNFNQSVGIDTDVKGAAQGAIRTATRAFTTVRAIANIQQGLQGDEGSAFRTVVGLSQITLNFGASFNEYFLASVRATEKSIQSVLASIEDIIQGEESYVIRSIRQQNAPRLKQLRETKAKAEFKNKISIGVELAVIALDIGAGVHQENIRIKQINRAATYKRNTQGPIINKR